MGVRIEAALEIAGPFGWWHWGVVSLAALPGFFFIWHHYGFVFVGGVPDHWCQVEELQHAGWTADQIRKVAIPSHTELGATIYSQCEMYKLNYTAIADMNPATIDVGNLHDAPVIECQHWDFDKSTFQSTVATDWELLCGRLHILSTLHSLLPFGVLIGSVAIGPLSDRFGRRKCTLVSICFMIVSAVGSIFCNEYISLGIMRFILGWATFGMYASCYSLVAELCPVNKRLTATFVFDLISSTARWGLSLTAYLFRNWHDLMLAYSLPSLLCVICYWILPESPRWLLVKGRRAEAEKILLRAAKWNKVVLPDQDTTKKLLDATQEEDEAATHVPLKESLFVKVANVVTVFILTKEMRKRSIPMFFCWFVIAFASYGLLFHFAKMPFDLYLMHGINGMLVCLGRLTVVLWPLPDKIGRKKFFMGSFLLAGAAGLSILAVPNDLEWLSVTLSLATSGFVSLTFTLVYLYTAELFPTEVRNASITMGSVFARIGGISAPYVANYLYAFHYAIPTAVFGGMAALAAVVCSFLPETMGRRLPETVAELEETSGAISMNQLD